MSLGAACITAIGGGLMTVFGAVVVTIGVRLIALALTAPRF